MRVSLDVWPGRSEIDILLPSSSMQGVFRGKYLTRLLGALHLFGDLVHNVGFVYSGISAI